MCSLTAQAVDTYSIDRSLNMQWYHSMTGFYSTRSAHTEAQIVRVTKVE